MASASTRQLLEDLKDQLQAAVWTGSSNVIFQADSVLVSTLDASDAALKTRSCPIAIIAPGPEQVDPEFNEEPGLIQREITIRIIVAVEGDDVGEHAILGANIADSDLSEGKGLYHLQEEIFNNIEYFNRHDNVHIQFRAQSEAATFLDDTNRHVAWVDYTFTAQTTTDDI